MAVAVAVVVVSTRAVVNNHFVFDRSELILISCCCCCCCCFVGCSGSFLRFRLRKNNQAIELEILSCRKPIKQETQPQPLFLRLLSDLNQALVNDDASTENTLNSPNPNPNPNPPPDDQLPRGTILERHTTVFLVVLHASYCFLATAIFLERSS